MRTVILFMLYSFTILLEKYFSFLIPISFNRSTDDLKKNSNKLINNIKKPLSIRKLEACDVYPVIGNELGKGQYVTGAKISYLNAELQLEKKDLAVKYLSQRDEPLILSSLKTAIYRGLDREVTFYNDLSEEIPFVTPNCIFADTIPWLYRGVITMEKLTPDLLVDDYKGCNLEQSRSVIKNISRMHAKFWNTVTTEPSAKWLPDRHPLDILWFLKYMSFKKKACNKLWKALYQYFKHHPLTVTHGDCRPGNIMWFKNGDIAMLDWQFVHAGIGTWDTTYYIIMAHDIEMRRTNEDLLMKQYFSNLSDSYQEYSYGNFSYSEDKCMTDYQLLKIVLALYAWAALITHMFDKYGNDPRDVRCWADRITTAIIDLDSSFVSEKINLPSHVLDDFKEIMKSASAVTKERFVE